jgi:DNA repair photolyase
MKNLFVEEIECKTILNKSVMGFADYTLNAYQGCAFGCSYCYVPVMRSRRGQVDETRWGRWVQVKVNAPDVLRRQMLKVEPDARITIGTSTDSWQPLEKFYRITRQLLIEFSYYPNPLSILTRSPLLLRDIELLQRISNISVGVSLPTFDDGIRRAFEPFAPAIPGRVHLIKKLVEAGLPPSLACAPILPGVTDTAEFVQDYLRRTADLGVRRVWFGMFNYTEQLTAPHLRLRQAYREKAGTPTAPSIPKYRLAEEVRRCGREYGVEVSI